MENMVVQSRNIDTDGNPIDGALMDAWQTNGKGFHDVQQKGHQQEFNLRGDFTAGGNVSHRFRAVTSKFWPIPGDGPVGRLLGQLGRHCHRPAHIHHIISAPGQDTLTTRIFEPDDPCINSDAAFTVKESVLAEFEKMEDREWGSTVPIGSLNSTLFRPGPEPKDPSAMRPHRPSGPAAKFAPGPAKP